MEDYAAKKVLSKKLIANIITKPTKKNCKEVTIVLSRFFRRRKNKKKTILTLEKKHAKGK